MDVPERFNAATFFVDRHVTEGRGGRIAFRFAGRGITYSEVADLVARAAGAVGRLLSRDLDRASGGVLARAAE